MWTFKKPPPVKKDTDITVTTVMRIPGLWASADEVRSSVFSATQSDFVIAGDMLLSIKRQRHYRLEIAGKNDRLKALFRYAGASAGIADEYLRQIENNTHSVIISGITGNPAEAENIACAGAAILKAGGIALNVETIGKAFGKTEWLDMTEDCGVEDLYRMFVTIGVSNRNDSAWSCGMHNLGFKDVIVSGNDLDSLTELINVFNQHQLIDKKPVHNNDSFRINDASRLYCVSNEKHQPYGGIELFENPFGMWRLNKV